MRKKFLQFCGKLDFKFCLLYTWMLRSGFKSCGPNVQLHYPIKLGNPEFISLGAGTFVNPRCFMNAVTEWAGIRYAGEIVIGDRVGLGFGVQISAAKLIVIEDDVALSSGVVIVDHIHDYHHLNVPVFNAPLSEPLPVRIGKGSFLGANCLVGPGVQIGEHAVVAANSVVTTNLPSFAIAIGNPARMVRFHNPEKANALASEMSKTESA